MSRCDDPDCNGHTEFDETAQAIVCINCGKVVNHAIFRDDWDGETAGSSFYFGPTGLKSLRRVGANLSGLYDKEERDRRNMVCVFFKSLETQLQVLHSMPCTSILPQY